MADGKNVWDWNVGVMGVEVDGCWALVPVLSGGFDVPKGSAEVPGCVRTGAEFRGAGCGLESVASEGDRGVLEIEGLKLECGGAPALREVCGVT